MPEGESAHYKQPLEATPNQTPQKEEKTVDDFLKQRERLFRRLSALYNPLSSLVPPRMPAVSTEDRNSLFTQAQLQSNKTVKRHIRQREREIQQYRRSRGPDERWPILK